MESLKFFREVAQEVDALVVENQQLRSAIVEIAKKLNCYPACPSKYQKASEGGLASVILAVLEDAAIVDAHVLATVPKADSESKT